MVRRRPALALATIMRDDDRVVLLAWPRSGSSSLWRILGAHPDLSLMPDEPFNESFVDWSPGNPDYLSRVRDVDSLDVVLDELFGRFRGIKVLTYQLDQDQLAHLVGRREVRSIVIARRNLLQTAVSDRIAKQTKVWNRWDVDPNESLSRRYDSLRPLDLDDLHSYIRDLAAHLRWVESVLDPRQDGRVFRLCYEDLYFGTPGDQRAQLDALWAFLGLPPLDATDIAFFLDPRSAKLGGSQTYGLLPNAVQIDAALGADDTGWLLPFLDV
jgi:hypothetical protein